MILDRLANAGRYVALHPGFADAFAFLRQQDLAELEEGRYEITRDQVYALVMNAEGKGQADAKLETHNRYIDIQVAVKGDDLIGWAPVTPTSNGEGYDEEKDLQFYRDPVQSWVNVPQGSFAIFFPKDAHAPCAGDAPVMKVVVKVAVEM